MSGWPEVPLAQAAEIDRDGFSPAAIPTGSFYVGLENIQGDGSIVAAKRVMNGELASAKFKFGPHHVLFGKLRPYLAKVACPMFEGICSTDILPLRPSASLSRRYLYHFLRRPETISRVSSLSVGINLPRISPRILMTLPIPMPPLVEQRRIAEVLDRADALRAKRRAALAQLDELTQSIFLDMFGDPLYGFNFKNVSIEELASGGPQNGLYKPADCYGTGTPILRIDDFNGGRVSTPEGLKRLRLTSQEIQRYGLQVGDIVVNRVNSISHLGKVALIRILTEETVYESNMMRVRLDSSRILPEFAVMAMQSRHFKDQVRNAAKHAVNQSSINQRDLVSFRLDLPPLTDQRQFVDSLAAINRVKARQLSSVADCNALFASLQHRAFRGEL